MDNINCFCDTNKKVVKFIPEIEPEEIAVTKNIFNYKFPKFNSKIDFTKLASSAKQFLNEQFKKLEQTKVTEERLECSNNVKCIVSVKNVEPERSQL